LRDLDVNVREILKTILENERVRVWTKFKRLKTERSDWFL
jgi:activator of HSP90 ATPase